jgi:hypothetical protein
METKRLRDLEIENRILEKELRRLRIKNLRLKLHMEVLLHHPLSAAAEKLSADYLVKANMSESIINLN